MRFKSLKNVSALCWIISVCSKLLCWEFSQSKCKATFKSNSWTFTFLNLNKTSLNATSGYEKLWLECLLYFGVCTTFPLAEAFMQNLTCYIQYNHQHSTLPQKVWRCGCGHRSYINTERISNLCLPVLDWFVALFNDRLWSVTHFLVHCCNAALNGKGKQNLWLWNNIY